MINPLSIVTGILMATVIGHTFEVKRHVGTLDRELRDIRRATEEVDIRTQTLAAEWARLNDQERLRNLADRHLGQMVPMQPAQFVRHEEGVRRLPIALAWAGEISPFAPRREAVAVVRDVPEPAASTPVTQMAAATSGPGTRPAAAPGVQSSAPAAIAPGRPIQLAEATAARPTAVAPRAAPAAPEVTQRSAAPASSLPSVAAPVRSATPPLLNPTLPNVAAPPAPSASPRVAPGIPQAPRPPILATLATPLRVADGAVLPPARPVMLAQRVDTGSMLGGQAVAMAPPVPWGR